MQRVIVFLGGGALSVTLLHTTTAQQPASDYTPASVKQTNRKGRRVCRFTILWSRLTYSTPYSMPHFMQMTVCIFRALTNGTAGKLIAECAPVSQGCPGATATLLLSVPPVATF